MMPAPLVLISFNKITCESTCEASLNFVNRRSLLNRIVTVRRREVLVVEFYSIKVSSTDRETGIRACTLGTRRSPALSLSGGKAY